MPTPPKNRWLEPGSLIGIAGFGWMIVAGIMTFKDTTRDVISDLQSRVSVIEREIAIYHGNGRRGD